MVNLASLRATRATKVPEVGAGFWTIKLLSTAMGEATSDFLVHRYSPPVVVLVTAVVFLASLAWQFTRPRYQTLPYWSAVVMVSVFGTMCADVAHVGLGIAYGVSTTGLGVILATTFVLWHRVERSLSIHSITTPRREVFYWVAVTTTFALGTAAGDMTAVTLHLGYFTSGLLFSALFVLPGLGYRYAQVNPVAAFWTSYVLTRPLGASFADWLGVSRARGGLDWGPGHVALGFTFAIVIGVLALARAERPRAVVRARGVRTIRVRR